MRFFADGPNLPDELLEQCDNGEVVFFCGAGVSKNEGLPDFEELTQQVLDHFSPQDAAESQITFKVYYKEQKQPVLDQVFRCLHEEFGIDQVNRVVAEKLVTTEDYVSKGHQLLLTLSQNLKGVPQIVTTNFDLLFEQALDSFLPIYQAPFFPRLEHGMSIEGITYIHGKLAPADAERHDYILSSADFGKAYLSQGWATEFVRSLLETKTVVLIGYQAEDPPIKYLLEGLNQSSNVNNEIYAFDVDSTDVASKWLNKGVKGVTCSSYEDLWEVLSYWSERKKDPRLWRENVLRKAESSPSKLASWERGQVAHILKTIAGAKAFANHKPLIHPKWICVLDEKCRLGNISKDFFGDKSIYDPIHDFALDDDPKRFEDEKIDLSLGQYNRLLAALKFDEMRNASLTIVDYDPSIPPRLFYLSIWILKSVNSPVILWWLFRQNKLNPWLLRRLIESIDYDEIGAVAYKYWRLALEHFGRAEFISAYLDPMYDFCDRVAKEGWTYRALREFETLLTPFTEIEPPFFGHGRVKPPEKGWDDLSLHDFVQFKVKTLELNVEQLSVPDGKLPQILRVLEGLLIRSETLISEVFEIRLDRLTCYDDREVTGRSYSKYTLFDLYISLFKRYLLVAPSAVKHIVLTWPSDFSVFGMLRLFAFNDKNLFSAEEVIKELLSMREEVLFDRSIKREFIFLIEDRHHEFEKKDLESLVDKLLLYADSKDEKFDPEEAQNNLELVCRYSRRLQLGGVSFNKLQRDKLSYLINQIKDQIPNWSDAWAEEVTKLRLTETSSSRSPEEDSPEILLTLPISDVIKKSVELGRRDFDEDIRYRPFSGLVKDYPRRAILALCYELRQKNFEKEFWDKMMEHILSCSSTRYKTFLFQKLIRLKEPFFQKFSRSLSSWMKDNRKAFEAFDKELYWQLFESITTKLTSDAVKDMSQATFHRESYQSTEANLVNILFDCMDEPELDISKEIPPKIKSYFERLIRSETGGNDKVKYVLANELPWLSRIDPAWAKQTLIPWFDSESHESYAAWEGYLRCHNPSLSEEFADLIYPKIGRLFPAVYDFKDADNMARRASTILFELSSTQKTGLWALPPEIARNAIRNMQEKNRKDVISRLSAIGQSDWKNWQERVIPFIENCWPKDLSIQSPELTRSWLSLLSETGDSFSKIFHLVRDKLRPIGGFRTPLSHLNRKRITATFPKEMLDLLLLVVHKDNVPMDAVSVLNSIVEAEPRLKGEPKYHKLMKVIENY
ncbi:SIR2 family protein [Marinomonas fungiae]|uniref:SIR2 family protein n=1 Tax=Marinomonas fungiae TaxID=1137284 RepID=UPI003A957FC4